MADILSATAVRRRFLPISRSGYAGVVDAAAMGGERDRQASEIIGGIAPIPGQSALLTTILKAAVQEVRQPIARQEGLSCASYAQVIIESFAMQGCLTMAFTRGMTHLQPKCRLLINTALLTLDPSAEAQRVDENAITDAEADGLLLLGGRG